VTDTVIHKEKHPLAGRTFMIRKDARHRQYGNFGGNMLTIEDWWDRLGHGSWKVAQGFPAAIVYALRVRDNELPMDDEVVCGKTPDGMSHLVHVSELCSLDSE